MLGAAAAGGANSRDGNVSATNAGGGKKSAGGSANKGEKLKFQGFT